MTETTAPSPAANGGVSRTYDDKDFLVLSEEVERLAGIVGELIESAKRQHNLVGLLIDATGLAPVAERASVVEKLIPILSNMANRVAAIEIRIDEADVPTVDTSGWPGGEDKPGNALRTYFDGYSDAEVDAYRETL